MNRFCLTQKWGPRVIVQWLMTWGPHFALFSRRDFNIIYSLFYIRPKYFSTTFPILRFQEFRSFPFYVSSKILCSFRFCCIFCFRISFKRIAPSLFPVIVKGSHYIIKLLASCDGHDVRLNLIHRDIAPLIFKSHNVAEGYAVFVWLSQIILPHILKDDVLVYGEGFALVVRVFDVSHIF